MVSLSNLIRSPLLHLSNFEKQVSTPPPLPLTLTKKKKKLSDPLVDNNRCLCGAVVG